MTLSKSSKIIIIIIGIVAVLAGIYAIATGGEFDEYWLPFFGGFTLLGVVFTSSKRQTN